MCRQKRKPLFEMFWFYMDIAQLALEKRLFCLFFWTKFSRPNGRLSPVACHTYLESLCISGQFQLSGNHFSASSKASDFCWQTRLDIPEHLTMTHMNIFTCGRQKCLAKTQAYCWRNKIMKSYFLQSFVLFSSTESVPQH